jgi:hypothetical protein
MHPQKAGSGLLLLGYYLSLDGTLDFHIYT